MLEIEVNGVRYSNMFQRIEWTGGSKGTFRSLNIESWKNKLPILLGEKIKFYADNKLIFQGLTAKIDKSNEEIDTFTFYDNGIYLNKNKFIKNIFNKMPSEILKEICGELGLEVGKLPVDKAKCSYPAIDRSGYQIILIAYTIQHNKDGKVYSINVDANGAIEVIEQGSLIAYTLNTMRDIRKSKFSESMEDIINQIVVYKTEGDKAQIIEKVEDAESKARFGVFQDVMRYEGDMNNIFNARDMLRKFKQRASITVNGNIELISGYSVGVEEAKTGLFGNFLIEKDRHIWTSNDYYVELDLAFENTMDKIEFEKEQAKSETKYVDSEYTVNEDKLQKGG